MIIEGYVGKKIFNNEDYKVYSFYPIGESEKLVKLNKYNNISICGEMPDLYEEILYKIDVEYNKKGKYENYIVSKVVTDKSNDNVKITKAFLNSLISENQVNTIIEFYPDIIDRIINNKIIDTNKLFGIGEKTMDKIKLKVIENFQLKDLVAEYSDYGMTLSMIKKIYRFYNSVELVKKKMKENPYKCLCNLNRVGFKTADKIILNKFPNKINDISRASSCLIYLLQKNEDNGNTWISLTELYKNFMELVPECQDHFNKILKDNKIYFNKDNQRISLLNTYETELKVSNIIKEFLNNNDELKINHMKYNTVNDIPLTNEQMKILENVCKYNINILSGFGGTGKSFSIKALVNMLDDNKLNYILLSPTGKASKVLSEYTGKEAKTIHRGLGFSPEGFKYNNDNKLPYNFVIVDEFSMIDIFLLKHLLDAIDIEHTKLLFIGDPAQIPSVGVGNIAFDLMQSHIIPTVLLTTVFRYGEGGLSYVATHIREGKKYLDTNKSINVFGKKQDYVYINTIQENSLECIKTLYMNLYKKNISIDDIMILSAYNKGEYGTFKINSMIQDSINPKSTLKNEMISKRMDINIIFREGDRILQTKNNYEARTVDDETTCIYNGDIGTILKITKDEMIVEIDNKQIVYTKSQLNELTLAYALSIHKSQGSSSKYVIVLTPKAHKFFLDRNLLYVAASRAEEKLYHISTTDVISSALKKSQNFSRNTFLKDMLDNNKIN